MILLVTSSPKKYQKASSLHCLEVQAVSEVCLKTKRILGQRSVNRDGSQTQLVGNRLKKNKTKHTQQQMSTGKRMIYLRVKKNSHIKLWLKDFTHKIECLRIKTLLPYSLAEKYKRRCLFYDKRCIAC